MIRKTNVAPWKQHSIIIYFFKLFSAVFLTKKILKYDSEAKCRGEKLSTTFSLLFVWIYTIEYLGLYKDSKALRLFFLTMVTILFTLFHSHTIHEEQESWKVSNKKRRFLFQDIDNAMFKLSLNRSEKYFENN